VRQAKQALLLLLTTTQLQCIKGQPTVSVYLALMPLSSAPLIAFGCNPCSASLTEFTLVLQVIIKRGYSRVDPAAAAGLFRLLRASRRFKCCA
jgi:hypothetical protein